MEDKNFSDNPYKRITQKELDFKTEFNEEILGTTEKINYEQILMRLVAKTFDAATRRHLEEGEDEFRNALESLATGMCPMFDVPYDEEIKKIDKKLEEELTKANINKIYKKYLIGTGTQDRLRAREDAKQDIISKASTEKFRYLISLMDRIGLLLTSAVEINVD